MSKSIAVLLYDGCTLTEVMDFITLFGEDNAITYIDGSLKGNGKSTTTEGLSLEHLQLPVSLKDNVFDCVIVAGGNVAAIIDNHEIGDFLREKYEDPGTVCSGICNGAWVLAKAGLLKGKKVTHMAHPSCGAPQSLIDMATPAFKDSIYCHDNVVVDGRIVTAKPWAKAEFTIQVAVLAGVLEKDRADDFRRYLTGSYTPHVDSPDSKWMQEFPGAITVVDRDGTILTMNEKAGKTFIKDGGSLLIGKNVLACHPAPAREKLAEMLKNGQQNAYTIEKNGIKKLIYQSPWFIEGKYAGFIELSLEIPFELPHFVRN